MSVEVTGSVCNHKIREWLNFKRFPSHHKQFRGSPQTFTETSHLDKVTAKCRSYSPNKPQNIRSKSCKTNWLRHSVAVATNYYMSTHNNCDQETNPESQYQPLSSLLVDSIRGVYKWNYLICFLDTSWYLFTQGWRNSWYMCEGGFSRKVYSESGVWSAIISWITGITQNKWW